MGNSFTEEIKWWGNRKRDFSEFVDVHQGGRADETKAHDVQRKRKKYRERFEKFKFVVTTYSKRGSIRDF